MTKIQIWRHSKSGEDFVVKVDDGGQAIEAAGPLHHSEVEAALKGDFDTDPEMVADMNEHGENYVLFFEQN
jgi:hypothetical protein